MELKDRLKQARKFANLTQAEVVARIDNLSQPAYSQLEQGKVKSSAKMVELANLFGVNPTWLATGQGEMNLSFDNNVEVIKPIGKIRQIPILNEVSAGIFQDIGQNSHDEFEPIIDNGSYNQNLFWLRIKGDSMTPLFKTGDIILVDMDATPKAGDYIVAMQENGESTFKKLKIAFDEQTKSEYMQLIPLNEFYQTIDSRYQPFTIVGKVIEKKEFF